MVPFLAQRRPELDAHAPDFFAQPFRIALVPGIGAFARAGVSLRLFVKRSAAATKRRVVEVKPVAAHPALQEIAALGLQLTDAEDALGLKPLLGLRTAARNLPHRKRSQKRRFVAR